MEKKTLLAATTVQMFSSPNMFCSEGMALQQLTVLC